MVMAAIRVVKDVVIPPVIVLKTDNNILLKTFIIK